MPIHHTEMKSFSILTLKTIQFCIPLDTKTKLISIQTKPSHFRPSHKTKSILIPTLKSSQVPPPTPNPSLFRPPTQQPRQFRRRHYNHVIFGLCCFCVLYLPVRVLVIPLHVLVIQQQYVLYNYEYHSYYS